MRPEVAGLTIYLYGIVRYTNLISYIIFQNGIIYHYFYPENKWIRLGDTLCNGILLSHVVYHEPLARKYARFVFVSYLFNLLYNNSLVHVYGVQFPLFLGLEQYITHFLKKKISYLAQ